jgi:peptidoglycan/LPS O-acetylase OafA/YrhL
MSGAADDDGENAEVTAVLREPAPAEALDQGPGAARPEKPRLLHVDGLRALAALWVVVYHAQLGFLPGLSDGMLGYALGLGVLAIPVFLVLSGFCLAFPVVSRGRSRVDLKSFAIRRALRILPPYYIVMISLAALQRLPIVADRTVREVTDLPDFAAHLFMVHNLWPEHMLRISGPFWSIALECQLYVVFPLLLMFVDRPRTLLTGALAVAAGWWLAAPHVIGSIPFHAPLGTVPGDTAFAYWNSMPSMLPLFVFGIVAARRLARPQPAVRWSAGLGVTLMVVALFAYEVVDWPVASKLLAGVATALILLRPAGRICQALSWRPLVRIGEASFTLYLIHQALMSPVWKLTAGRLPTPALVLVGAATVAFAVAVSLPLSRLIEQPFHRLARRVAAPAPSTPIQEGLS